MVAVSHRDADNFIVSAPASIDVYLIFGTDIGLVYERSCNILKNLGFEPRDPEQVLRLDGDAVSVDPGLLFDETHTTGLFSSKRSILMRAGTRQILSPVELALSEPSPDCKIVIQAGALRKDAPLRSLVTRARNGAAIECYPDQARDIERLVETELKSAGLKIEAKARNVLVGLLGDDRLSTRAELEKLILFAHGQQQITEAQVIEAVADASAFAQDSIVYAAFSGKLAVLGEEGASLYRSGSEVAALMAAGQRHLYMLHAIKIATDSGMSPDTAIERSGGRTVFGAKREMLSHQVRIWQRSAIAILIEESNRILKESRADSALAIPLILDFFIRVARQARARSASG